MKLNNLIKLLSVAMFLMCLPILKVSAAGGIVKIIVQDDKDYFEDENLKIKFHFSNTNLYMTVQNKLDERIYIEWENARTNGDKIIFGTDNKLSYRNKKEDEAISSKTTSISRCFYCENPMAAISGNWAMPVYTHGILKLEEEDFCSVNYILPIRFSNGETKDYKIYVKLMYINQADASKVTLGMKQKEVKKLMGTPEVVKKNKAVKNEVWRYTNNVTIVFDDNKVSNIAPLAK